MPKLRAKIETISSDEYDIDCFGNFSSKEKLCTNECGLSKQCSIVTKSLADEKNKLYQIKSSFDADIKNSKKDISKNNKILNLKNKLEEKHKKVKKQMSKEEKKIKKKKSSDTKMNIVKAPKKTSLEKKKVSKEGKSPGRKSKSSFETVHNTVIPVGFESMYKYAKGIDGVEIIKKASVTNVKLSSGIVFCFTKTGTTEKKLSVYLNRSAGYEGFKKASEVEVVNHSKGDFILNVKKTSESQAEAVKLLSKWVKDRDSFLSEQKSSGSKPKKKKATKEEKEDKPSKKKVNKNEKADKPEKSEKKSPSKKEEKPSVKKKKKPSVEEEG